MKTKTKAIHTELLSLVSGQRRILSETLELLADLNHRKGFLEFGHRSLLKYCVKELGLSEGAAYRRIKAMKLMNGSQEVKEKLEKGNVNLAQLSKAQELFDEYQKENDKKVPEYKKLQMLGSLEKKSLHDSENMIRKELDMPEKERVITIKVKEETYQMWNDFKARMVHKNMSDEMLLRFSIMKAERVETPKRIQKAREHDPDSRYIPAHLKREVFEKANYKCSWKDCDSVYGLEVDHILPVSKGGKTEAANLRLLCRHHNQFRNFD